MRYYNKYTYKNLYAADSTNGGVIGGSLQINVDTDELATYGAYLENTEEELNTLLDSLNDAMAVLTNDWADADGAQVVAKFSDFINEAKGIGTQLHSLGTYAKGMASNYSTLLEECLTKMNSGG